MLSVTRQGSACDLASVHFSLTIRRTDIVVWWWRTDGRSLLTKQFDWNAELCSGQDEQLAPRFFQQDRLVAERQLEERGNALCPADAQQQQPRRAIVQTCATEYLIPPWSWTINPKWLHYNRQVVDTRLANRPFYFLTFGHSGAQSWAGKSKTKNGRLASLTSADPLVTVPILEFWAKWVNHPSDS